MKRFLKITATAVLIVFLLSSCLTVHIAPHRYSSQPQKVERNKPLKNPQNHSPEGEKPYREPEDDDKPQESPQNDGPMPQSDPGMPPQQR